MRRFWISWYEPAEDPRPVKLPLPEAIKGWWITGEDMNDRVTICAVIDAEDSGDAWEIVSEWWTPDNFRFCEEKGLDWLPGDRFPK